MYDIHKDLQQILSKQELPVYYEGNQLSDIQVPCITYYIITDASLYEGDTMRYSDLTFRVNIWGTRLSDTQPVAQTIDLLMKQYGCKRNSVNDMWIDSQLFKKIITYSCKTRELL